MERTTDLSTGCHQASQKQPRKWSKALWRKRELKEWWLSCLRLDTKEGISWWRWRTNQWPWETQTSGGCISVDHCSEATPQSKTDASSPRRDSARSGDQSHSGARCRWTDQNATRIRELAFVRCRRESPSIRVQRTPALVLFRYERKSQHCRLKWVIRISWRIFVTNKKRLICTNSCKWPMDSWTSTIDV